MISESKAEEMVKEHIDNKNLRKHMYAVSAIMEKLAEETGRDSKKWKLAGLLHDIDYEKTKDEPHLHSLISVDMLEKSLPKDCLHAIKCHNFEHTDQKPEDKFDYALIAADAISGLVVATALVMPNRSLEEVRVESVMKKIDDSSFAKNINRDRIYYSEKLDMDIEEFVELSIDALEGINEKLGL